MNSYDIVVVGGGINGVGVAQAGVAAGYSVLVLEQQALASGTSSRSSKLIHGGLRYLETLELGLVYEALKERSLLLKLAPDLVHLEPFFIPVYRRSRRRSSYIRAGLTLYSLLGRDAGARFASISRTKWEEFDGLRCDGLESLFQYYDARTDDAALTRAVMRSAISLGAELACPAGFVSAQRADDGFEVAFDDGLARTCRTRALVNAAGPWVADVAKEIAPASPALELELIQGSHAVLQGEVSRGCYYLEADDRRGVFVLPWQGHSLVGTTEVSFIGDPARAEPQAREIDYLRDTFARHFPSLSDRVLSSFAGVRVLPRDNGAAFGRSREVRLVSDTHTRPHVISICGGKLTAYRRTAAKVIRRLRPVLGWRDPRADTARLYLAPD